MLCNCISINICSIYNNYDIRREFLRENKTANTIAQILTNFEAGKSTAGNTTEEHILQSQETDQNRTQENFYQLTGEVYNNKQVLHECNLRYSVAIQNAKTYLAKMIIHYTKYTLKKIICKQAASCALKESGQLKSKGCKP